MTDLKKMVVECFRNHSMLLKKFRRTDV